MSITGFFTFLSKEVKVVFSGLEEVLFGGLEAMVFFNYEGYLFKLLCDSLPAVTFLIFNVLILWVEPSCVTDVTLFTDFDIYNFFTETSLLRLVFNCELFGTLGVF